MTGGLVYSKMSNKSVLDLLPTTFDRVSAFSQDFVIQDNSIILDHDKATLNITPHTLSGSGWVNFDLTTKNFSGDLDFAFGFTDEAKPLRAEFYNPHNVTELKSSTCDERVPGYANGINTTLKRAWCFFTYFDDTSQQNITRLVFNRTYDSINMSSRTIFWNETHVEDWKLISNQKVQKIEKDFGNLTKWFLFKNKIVQDNTNYRLRYYLSVPYNSDGKYGIAIKRTQDTLEQAQASGNLVFLDPWYNDSYTDDFHVQHGGANIATSSSTVTIVAGTDYDAPFNNSLAFIRLVNTRLSGGGHDSGGGSQATDDWMVSISNPENIATNITFERGGSSASFNTEISWEIIEFAGGSNTTDNEIIVRRVEAIDTDGTNLTFNGTATNDIVDNNAVMIIITGQRMTSVELSFSNRGMYTAEWNTTTNQSQLTKKQGGAGAVSYALLEFTGSNWEDVQRIEHNMFAAAGVEEFEPFPTGFANISNVISHTQNTPNTGNLDDLGISMRVFNTTHAGFLLQSGGATNNMGVVWAVENNGTDNNKSLFVQRAYTARVAGGPEPDIFNHFFPIATDNINTTSIWGFSSISAGSGTALPRGSFNINVFNTTTATLFQSDSGQNKNYAFEFVQFPTANLAPADTVPQSSNNLTNSTVAGAFVLHSVTWTDDTALSGYIFEFSNGTGVALTNDSFVTFTGTTNESNVTKIINTTVGPFITWRVYANDSSNNLNSTELFNYTTTTSDSCTYSGSGNFAVLCSDNCNIYSNVIGDGSNLTLSGTGNFNVQANITGFLEVHKENACFVIKSNEAQIELTN